MKMFNSSNYTKFIYGVFFSIVLNLFKSVFLLSHFFITQKRIILKLYYNNSMIEIICYDRIVQLKLIKVDVIKSYYYL